MDSNLGGQLCNSGLAKELDVVSDVTELNSAVSNDCFPCAFNLLLNWIR